MDRDEGGPSEPRDARALAGVHDVGPSQQAMKYGLTLRGLQIDANAALVAIAAIGDVHGVPPWVAKGVDLDDVGAEVGQDLGAERPSDGEAQVEHRDAL